MVKELRLFSRRQLMATASLAASTAAAASFGIACASPLRSTPGQILGPFWPTQAKPDLSGDLTRVPGSTGRAMGQVLHVSGRVLNRDGMPVPNAKLDIWQGRCRGALGLRSGRWPNNRADEENQLRRIPVPARDYLPGDLTLSPVPAQVFATPKICWPSADWRCPTRSFGVG